MAHLGEIFLQPVEQRPLGAAAQHLGDEGAAGLQDLARKIMREFGKSHDAHMIDLGLPRRRRRHVAHHHVEGAELFEGLRKLRGR